MADFRPFSLADSLNAATGAAANTLTLRNAQNQMAGEQVYRDTARQAVVPAAPAGQPGPVAPQGLGSAEAPLPPGGIPMAAGAPMSQGAQAIQSLFQKETAGHQKGYNPDYHAQLLEEAGYPDRALAVRELADKRKGSKLGMQTQVLDFVARAAPLVTDQQSLDALRGGLQAVGIDPQMIPAQFTPETQQALQVMGMGAAKQAELMFKQMELKLKEREVRVKERDVAAKEKGEGSKPKYNDVRMRVADLFGGIYDPITGRIGGMDKTKTNKALGMMAKAERLLADSDLTPAEAVAKVAQEYGMMIPGAPAPAAKPPAAPGGFRILGYEDIPEGT